MENKERERIEQVANVLLNFGLIDSENVENPDWIANDGLDIFLKKIYASPEVPQPEPALLTKQPICDLFKCGCGQLALCQQEIDRLKGQLEVKHFNEEFEIRADEYRKAEARIKELETMVRELEYTLKER